MHIRSISVEHWRGLSMRLEDLSPALNLIYGPNESGKSRLVQALRFALFESSSGRSAHKRALETWGSVDGKPRVEVEFELNGERWQLEKVFLGTGYNTQLRGGGRTLKDEAAEARLSELMGVSPKGRGEIRPEECGIWSLLWVEQGQSREVPQHNPVSQAQLQDQLSAQIGEAAAGELGLRMLKQAEALRNRHYTASRDDETGALREARNRLEAVQSELTQARVRHQAVAADAGELETSRRREQALKERIRLAELAQTATEQRHRAAADAEKALAHCSLQVDRTRLGFERSDTELQRAQELDKRGDALNREIETLEKSHAGASTEFETARKACDQTTRELTDAEARSGELNQRLLRQKAHQKATALRDERARIVGRLEEAAGLAARINEIRSELTRIPALTNEDVEALRKLGQQVDQTRARLEGASVSIELHAHQDLNVDGVMLVTGESRTVLAEDERQIDIAGIAGIIVRPGAGELDGLRNRLADTELDLRRALQAAAVDDIAQADRIAQNRRDLDSELKQQRKALAQQLPEGRDELDATRKAIEAQLSAMDDGESKAFDPAELERTEREAQALIDRRDALRVSRDERMVVLGSARDRQRDLQIDIRSRREQLAVVLEHRSQLADDATLQANRQSDERAWQECVVARDAAKQTYERLGGARLELELEQARQSLRLLHEDARRTQSQTMQLDARLESAGAAGRFETVQELEGELNLAENQLQRIEREALATRRLHEVLSTEYRNARERLTQPVIARIRPYLAELFAASEVWLDEDLNLLGMRGERVDESFNELSGGAREQLSLLVRIGLAEVIGAQESWPLVLDDVLVNTDAERIRLIQRVLYQAARKMQILLFTCHGPLFDMLGPDRKIELNTEPRRRSL